MNNTDLIYLIKHFMHNELKAVEEVIYSPLSEFANLIKVLQSCQEKLFLLVLVSPVLLPENSQQLLPVPELLVFCSRYGSGTRRPWNGGERRCCYSYFKQW